MFLKEITKYLFAVILTSLSFHCSLITTRPVEVSQTKRDERFPARAPVQSTVRIYWNENRIPFMIANSDEDLAMAIGIVHAHLRGSQIQIFKRIAQGRISESAGPLTSEIDYTLRILSPGLAAKSIINKMDASTLKYVNAYLKGLNYGILNTERNWPSLKAAGIDTETFTLEELITVWRLFSADVNWFRMFQAFDAGEGNPETRAASWRNLMNPAVRSHPQSNAVRLFANALYSLSRAGSNSLVIAPSRSKSGKAMIASDPHVGLSLPPLWFLMGVRSQSFEAVGMTIPGLPVIALGRSRHLVWGGTNMWGMSTVLVDISDREDREFETRTEMIKIAGWPDREVEIRTSKFGPVISDSDFFTGYESKIAIHWTGHQSSDEIKTYLKILKSKNCEQFRQSFLTWAVSAQNYLCGDRSGNIYHILALRKPVPGAEVQSLVRSDSEAPVTYRNPLELPFKKNPTTGYLRSANNRPDFTGKIQPGLFYSKDDRVIRIDEIMSEKSKIGLSDLIHLQTDVCSISARKGLAQIIKYLEPGKIKDLLMQWDGCYVPGSKSAYVYESLLASIRDKLGLEIAAGENYEPVFKKLATNPKAFEIVRAAADDIDIQPWNLKTPVGHYLANIPVIGNAWSLEPVIEGGSNQTLQKRGFRFSDGEATVTYGANARHISDLSDSDENYFVLFGGQDAFMVSPNTVDQVELWKKGKMIQFPMNESTLIEQNWIQTELQPLNLNNQ